MWPSQETPGLKPRTFRAINCLNNQSAWKKSGFKQEVLCYKIFSTFRCEYEEIKPKVAFGPIVLLVFLYSCHSVPVVNCCCFSWSTGSMCGCYYTNVFFLQDTVFKNWHYKRNLLRPGAPNIGMRPTTKLHTSEVYVGWELQILKNCKIKFRKRRKFTFKTKE